MNLNVSLTSELVNYVKAKVETGRYSSASEVVREALRLLEEKDSHKAEERHRMRAVWQDGIASADYAPLDLEAVKAEGRARHAAKV